MEITNREDLKKARQLLRRLVRLAESENEALHAADDAARRDSNLDLTAAINKVGSQIEMYKRAEVMFTQGVDSLEGARQLLAAIVVATDSGDYMNRMSAYDLDLLFQKFGVKLKITFEQIKQPEASTASKEIK